MNLRSDMWLIREVCSLVANIRREEKLDKRIRLNGMIVFVKNAKGDRVYLGRKFLEIIADECNIVDQVASEKSYPPVEIINNGCMDHPEDYRTVFRDIKHEEFGRFEITVSLNVKYTPRAFAEFKEQKAYRDNMMREKRAGTYDISTYKKYKRLKKP